MWSTINFLVNHILSTKLKITISIPYRFMTLLNPARHPLMLRLTQSKTPLNLTTTATD